MEASNITAEQFKKLRAEYIEARLLQKRLEEQAADAKKKSNAIGFSLMQAMQDLEHKTTYSDDDARHRVTIAKRTTFSPTDGQAATRLISRFVRDGKLDFMKCDSAALRDIYQQLDEHADGLLEPGDVEFYRDNIKEFTKYHLTFTEGTPAPSAETF
jgi:hypothetical protein